MQDLEPAKVEDELEDEEKGNVDVKVSVVVPNLLDQIEQEFYVDEIMLFKATRLTAFGVSRSTG